MPAPRLGPTPYYLHVRCDHHVVSKAVVIATGVREDGHREILGVSVGDSEDELFWRTFLRSLKDRGLSGVKLVISDQHAGLVAAHRPLLPRRSPPTLPGPLRQEPARLCAQGQPGDGGCRLPDDLRPGDERGDVEPVGPRAHDLRRALREGSSPHGRGEGGGACLSAFPRAQWRQLWSTNPLERLNKELKRRCRVVGIFPTEAALIRLAGAVLLDTHEEWIAAERRYFSEASMAMLYPERDDVLAVTGELEGADTD